MPMRALLNKFISIFTIEVQDLEEDINDLLELLEKRRDSQEITNYVYLENKAVLLNEIACVKELLDKISAIDPYKYDSIEELISDLKKMLDRRIQECEFPEVVHSLVKRKFEKVCTYVMGARNTESSQR
jgi:predicted P-loop ATPase/GTPase